MPLGPHNTRTFHRGLYAGQLETVTVYKRGDDEKQSVITTHLLFDCRWSQIFKSGEPIAGDQSTEHYRDIHIPDIELSRVGILHINAIDKFMDKEGRSWQPEAPQLITSKLWEGHHCITCRRCDDVAIPGV